MSRIATTAVKSNRRTIAEICEHIRAEAETADWRALSGRTDSGFIDKAAILTECDIAQWTGRLAPFMSARDMAAGMGVKHPTATASMKRLEAQGWHTCMHWRHHPRDAEAYALNADYPLVYNFRQPRAGKTLPRAAAGDPRMFGDHGVYMPESHRDRMHEAEERNKKNKLLHWLLSPGGTFTQEGTRDWLLIGRTDTGNKLGKTAVTVYLYLKDGVGVTEEEIIEALRIPRKTACDALRRLEKLSLAYGMGKLWTRGAIAIEQFDPGTLRMEKRTAETKDERWTYALRFPVSREEYFRAELAQASSRIEKQFMEKTGGK